MNRALSVMLFLLLGTACQKEKHEPQPEKEGQLEGVWKVTSVDPVIYDRQNKIIASYPNTSPAVAGYTILTITSTELQYSDSYGIQGATPYVRDKDKLICPYPPPHRSYTIRKLTETALDLHLRGEYLPSGVNNAEERIDFTLHYARQ